MATALIRGLLDSGLYRADEIVASDVEAKKLAALKRRFGVLTAPDNGKLVAECDVVVLAVKPQILDAVLMPLRPMVRAKHLFISIAAGVPTRRIEAALGGNVRVLRVMPNTPALLGKGMSVLVRGRYAGVPDEKLGIKLFQSVGQAVAVQDERALDAVTGLSGSGPAYIYLIAEGLIAGGVAAGLTASLAAQLTYQTLAGAAAMLQETGEAPEALRAQVTSPGGTTFAGLGELNRRGIKDILVAAVIAATRRSQELGRS
jgi:pyrroline-5-carboxylate reductase